MNLSELHKGEFTLFYIKNKNKRYSSLKISKLGNLRKYKYPNF